MSRRMNSKGFTLIEVLIGVVLLSLAVLAYSAALRQAYSWKNKQQSYEAIGLMSVALVERLTGSPQNRNDILPQSGRYNNGDYSYRCEIVDSGRNHVMNMGMESQGGGDEGKYRVLLEECTLTVEYGEYLKKIIFYRTGFELL